MTAAVFFLQRHNMNITRRSFTKAGLFAGGAAFILPLQGCGQNSTLARIAPTIAPLADILATALNQMRLDKVISQAKYDELMKVDPATGLNLIGKIKDIGVYLIGVSVVTAGNKAEIIAKVREGIDLTVRVIGGLEPGSKGARVLSSIKIGLDAVMIAITIINPPPVGIASGAGAGIPASSVKVKTPKLDKDIEAELAVKMQK